MFSSNGSQVSDSVNYIEDMFSTYLYTGNDTTQIITNGIDLATKGGLVWVKARSGVTNHLLVDTAQGTSSRLFTNLTNAADSSGDFTSFDTTGFTFGGSSGARNNMGSTYVSWTFREQPKFFDVVTYTGNDVAGRAIPHNLGSVPGCIIVKRTSGISDWAVYHRGIANPNLYLNLTDSNNAAAAKYIWGNDVTSISPTATEFTIGGVNAGDTINNTGSTYVAYLFAHDAGGFGLTGTDNVISCGSYTGNGSTTGPVVTLGYEPQFLLLKPSSFADNWSMFDVARGMCVNTGVASDARLRPNDSSLETVTGADILSPTATGFQLTGTNGEQNQNGVTYIYIAIRRPMKVPTVGTSVFMPQTRSGTAAAVTVTGVGFAPDLTIFNTRNRTNFAWNFPFCDRLRGPTKQIHSNTTAAEATNTYGLLAYTMDGMSLGDDGTDSGINYNTSTYANYFFKRATGFFDEVCYTGTGSATTVTHNLGVVPELIITKSRSTLYSPAWGVYHAALGNTKYLNFLSSSADINASYWNDTTPTGSVFTINSNGAVNASGATYVAYLFATCPGVSKVGSYTGNGTTQTINCGFTGGARFVLIKRTDSTGGWYTYDTARGMTSGTDPYSLLNAHTNVTGNQEVDTLGSVTTVSTGFALNSAILADINVSSGTYIFLAIA